MIKISSGTAYEANGALAVGPTLFPDKTSQVWKLPEDAVRRLQEKGSASILWDFEAEAEFLHLAQLFMLLRALKLDATLDLPYLPYARQDKPVANDATFALHAFAGLLNSLQIREIRTLDAHSDVAAALIPGLVSRAPRREIEFARQATRADALLFPDAGAKRRYAQDPNAEALYADKHRDPLTGHITGIEIHGYVQGKRLLIVDDICDGGATFKLVAEQALKAGAAEVYLYVTHGIFSKGLETLRISGIRRIFTHRGEIPVEAV